MNRQRLGPLWPRRPCWLPAYGFALQTDRVDISLAGPADVDDLARLLWDHAGPAEQQQQTVESFAVELAVWRIDYSKSHFAFIARVASEVVGMAWVALVPRVPRPGVVVRYSGDIQSVFVLPENRGKGIGSRLVQAATEHAFCLGALRVTVQSGRKAVPVYERLGFASSPQLLQSPAE